MSLFREKDLQLPQLFVNQVNQSQQTDFRLVQLDPIDQRFNQVRIENDFFNHIEFNQTRGPLLRSIQAPQISRGNRIQHPEVIDLENNQNPQQLQSQNQAPQKQKLIQQPASAPFRPVKLEQKEFKNSKFAQPEEVANALNSTSNFFVRRISINEEEVLKSLDIYSRRNIRKTLSDSILQAQQLPDFNERLEKLRLFSSLNECIKQTESLSEEASQVKLFGDEKSLEFAQLNFILPYVNKSNLTRDLYPALLVNTRARIFQMAEYIIFNLVVNQEAEASYPMLYTLQLDSSNEELPFGEGLANVKGFDRSKVFVNLREEIKECEHIQSELLNSTQMQKITEILDEDTDKFGAMLYFGGLNETQADERKYRTQFLQHVILALKTLQVKGSLVLELKETFTNFSASMIYVLSKLFEQILLTKPYNSSPLSQTQFLVCTDLLKARPVSVISRLQELLDELVKKTSNCEKLNFEFCDLIDSKILMSEERFLSYIRGANEAIAIYRHQYIQLILENAQVPERYAQEMKNDLLKRWGLLLGDPSISQANRRSGTMGGVEDILERKLDVNQNFNPRSTQAYNPRATGRYGQASNYGGGSVYGGGRPSGNTQPDEKMQPPVFQEPAKKHTEQEMQQLRKQQEKEEKDLLNSIIGKREIEKRKQEAERKKKELIQLKERKEREEREQLEKKTQELKEKLLKSQAPKRKEKPKDKEATGASNDASNQGEQNGSKGGSNPDVKKRDAKAAVKEVLVNEKHYKQADSKSHSSGGGNMIRIQTSTPLKSTGDEKVGQKRKASRLSEEEEERVYRGESDFAQPAEDIQNQQASSSSSKIKLKIGASTQNQATRPTEISEEDLRSKEQELKRKLEEQKRILQEENKHKLLQNPRIQAMINKNKKQE